MSGFLYFVKIKNLIFRTVEDAGPYGRKGNAYAKNIMLDTCRYTDPIKRRLKASLLCVKGGGTPSA